MKNVNKNLLLNSCVTAFSQKLLITQDFCLFRIFIGAYKTFGITLPLN